MCTHARVYMRMYIHVYVVHISMYSYRIFIYIGGAGSTIVLFRACRDVSAVGHEMLATLARFSENAVPNFVAPLQKLLPTLQSTDLVVRGSFGPFMIFSPSLRLCLRDEGTCVGAKSRSRVDLFSFPAGLLDDVRFLYVLSYRLFQTLFKYNIRILFTKIY